MDNPEKQSRMGRQGTGGRQTKHRIQHRKLQTKNDEQYGQNPKRGWTVDI